MYGYIYDVFLHQKPYEKELIKLENALTDKDLKGPIIKLTLINNAAHAVDDLLRRGVKTLVAVGSDQLFSKLADQVADKEGITLALIPFGAHKHLAELFGIPGGSEAVPVLAARLVRQIKPAKINNACFIHSAQIHDSRAKITIDQQFSLQATSNEALVSIFNASLLETKENSEQKLAVMITPSEEKKLFRKPEQFPTTTIHADRVGVLEPKGVPIIVDGQKIINSPAEMSFSSSHLDVIVGKDRQIE